MLQTPILFLIFNRPELAETVFNVIRQQKPAKLYIAADGPRTNIEGEKEKCDATRNLVLNNIDWDCEVKTLLRDENQGCGKAVSAAITWFFECEDQGIILEDDCVPNDSFFSFCEDNLEKYQDDENIMMICGTSYQPKPLDKFSYYFSVYAHVWGWATWRRGWQKYSFTLTGFDERECEIMLKRYFGPDERSMWLSNFKDIINGFDTWDYQWMYCIWKNAGFTIIPWQNRIANIGFGPEATHTKYASPQAKIKTFDIKGISHPTTIKLNKPADKYERYHLLIGTPAKRLKRKIRLALKKYTGV